MQLFKLTNKLLFLLLERKQVGANLKHSTMYFLPSFEYSGEKWWYASFPLWHQNLICSVCVCQCQMDGWMKTQMGTNLLSQKVRQRERKIECDAFICLLYFKFQIHSWKYWYTCIHEVFRIQREESTAAAAAYTARHTGFPTSAGLSFCQALAAKAFSLMFLGSSLQSSTCQLACCSDIV